MTVTNAASQAIFLGNAATTSFNFNFIWVDSSDIEVVYTDSDGVETLLIQSTDYTLTLTQAVPPALWGIGGTVKYPISGSPIASGTTLTVRRILPEVQETVFANQNATFQSAVEQALDYCTMLVQQVAGMTSRWRGTWQTDTSYILGDIVQDGVNGQDTGALYLCIVANTSGVWLTDLAAGDWKIIFDPSVIITGVSSVTGTSNQITASPGTGAVVLTIPATFTAPGYVQASGSTSPTGQGFFTKAANTLGWSAGGTYVLGINSTGQMFGGPLAPSAVVTTVGAAAPAWQVHTNGNNGIGTFAWTNDTTASSFVTSKSRGTTVGSFTAVASGDQTGRWIVNATDGSAFVNNANLRFPVNGTVGTGIIPTDFQVELAAPTSGTLTKRFYVTALGNITLSQVALATNATDGFLNISSSAGVPSGTPTAYTGVKPIHIDSTNSNFYWYSGGAWNKALTAAGAVTSITGTANQITASASVGAVTLSIPSAFQAPGYVSVLGSSAAPNGIYLATTNTIGFSTNTTFRAALDGNGRFLMGDLATTSALTGTGSNVPFLQVQYAGNAALGAFRYSADALPSNIEFLKSRSATAGGFTIVQSGDVLMRLRVGGADGVKFAQAGNIEFRVDATPGVDDMPTTFAINLSPDGSATPTDRLTITNAGLFTVTGTFKNTNIGNWKALYTDGSGIEQPLALGAANTALLSSGASGAPTFTAIPISIAGTANQITASASTGAITLSIPSTFIAPGSIAATTTLSGVNLILTGATVPANGFNLIAANSVAMYTNTTEVLRANSSQQIMVGYTTHITTASTDPTIEVFTQTSAVPFLAGFRYTNDTAGAQLRGVKSRGATIGTNTIVQSGDTLFSLVGDGATGSDYQTAAIIKFQVDGTPGASNDMPGRIVFSCSPDGTATAVDYAKVTNAGNFVLQMNGALATSATDGFAYSATFAGLPTGTPTSYTGAAAFGIDTSAGAFMFYSGAWIDPRTVQINSQSAAYGIVMTDRGKLLLHPSSDNNARTFTLPANGTIALPVGTTISFYNQINTVTIAITTDTMYLASTGTTGSRTLAVYGLATAVKISATEWVINGVGLT